MQGKLSDILEEHLAGFYPNLEDVEKANKWIIRQLTDEAGPFPVRASKTLLSRPDLRLGPKVNVFEAKSLHLPFDVIASDNEANTSFFSLVRDGWTQELDEMTILQMIRVKKIALGILQNEVSSEKTQQYFQNLKLKPSMNCHPRRVALEGLKLYHLAGAASSFERASFNSLKSEILIRSYRLLSPLNVVPYPNTSASKRGNRLVEIVNGQQVAEIGETPEGALMFAGVLHAYLRKNGFASLVESWLEWAQPGYGIGELEAGYQKASRTEIRIEAREDVKTRPVPEVGSLGAAPGAFPIFEVKENENGKTHLQNFGVRIGGVDRRSPFVFRVFDAKEELIAESLPVTAHDLGIAARGRMDYDRNKFHQSHFFQDGQPHSAIGRRIRWKFPTYQ